MLKVIGRRFDIVFFKFNIVITLFELGFYYFDVIFFLWWFDFTFECHKSVLIQMYIS